MLTLTILIGMVSVLAMKLGAYKALALIFMVNSLSTVISGTVMDATSLYLFLGIIVGY